MELIFLGRGAAFNPKEGNNSAYFIDNNELFLIDCGESVFEKLIENDLLNNVTNVNLMITHTHSDHIGSLGSLVSYVYYVLNKKLNIILPMEPRYLSSIENILSCFDCSSEMYDYKNERDYDNKYKLFNSIRFIETKHKDGLNCYGIIFDTEKGIVYYSGDTREANIIRTLITGNQLIDKLYVDTTTANYPGNVHLNIDTLKAAIPEELIHKVYCMHINDDNCIKVALDYGFNVVEVLKE